MPIRSISGRSRWHVTSPGGELSGTAAWEIVERVVTRGNRNIHPAYRVALRVITPLVTSAVAAVSARIVQIEIRKRETRELSTHFLKSGGAATDRCRSNPMLHR